MTQGRTMQIQPGKKSATESKASCHVYIREKDENKQKNVDN